MAKEQIEIPMTGRITAVNITVGCVVKEGEVICVLESMKMENPILTPVGGKVTEVKISLGQVVEGGEIAVIIEY